MTPLKRILVGVDFEAPSFAALDWAIDLALQVGAKVTVLHTFEIPIVGIPDGAFVASAEHVSQLMETSQRSLAAAIEARSARGEELTSLLRDGVAWEEIHRVAEEVDAQLIAIGTHGRTGVARALLGSIAEKTIRSAKRPIVVVRAQPSAE